MKKAISLLAAFALVCTMGVATFAADDIPGTANALPATERSARIGTNASGEAVVGGNELFLVRNGKPAGVYEKLDPATEYKFDIYYNVTAGDLTGTGIDLSDDTKTKQVTGADLDGGEIRLRTVKGSSNVQSARVRSIGRGATQTYQLVITTRASYGTKVNDVEYRLDPHNLGGSATTLKESVAGFEVGYEAMNDSDLDIGEGGYVTISNDFPVITKNQFTDLAKNVNYKTVNFEAEDGGWRYTGRVAGMSDTNFYYDYNVFPELIDMYPDQDYKFLTFRGGVTFPSAGEMRIDVDDIVDSFGANSIYTYLYRNGKLTRIDTTFDSSSREVVFRTNYLGAFVLTDKAITDSNILGGNEEPEQPNKPGTPNGGTGNNPNTGADRTVDLAVTLGLVSLVTAGALNRKKHSK